MSYAERLRDIAGSMLQSSSDPSAVKSAAEILKLASDIEKQETETRKAALEEAKTKHDLENAQRNRRAESRKAYITLLTPAITTLVVVGTLLFQFYQFQRTESEKTRESENARWEQSFKQFSDAEKISSAVVFVKTWANSPAYSERARALAEQLLYRPEDTSVFEGIFKALYDPVTAENLPQVVGVNRKLNNVVARLVADPKTNRDRPAEELEPNERMTYDLLIKQVNFTSAKICPAFKEFHAFAAAASDLSGTYISFCDLSNVDLRGVNLAGTVLESANLKGAKLVGVANYQGFDPLATAWWEADQISDDFRSYLKSHFPFNPQWRYPLNQNVEEYQASLARLESKKPN